MECDENSVRAGRDRADDGGGDAHCMRTVVDALLDRSGGHADPLTVLGDGGAATSTTTWAAVHDRARRMAAVLSAGGPGGARGRGARRQRRGIGPGRRVGLLADTGADLVAALQAVWLTGAAVTVLPPPAGRGRRAYAEQLRAVVTDAGLDLVLVGTTGPAEPAASEHGGGLARPALATAPELVPLAELAAAAGAAEPAPAHRPDPADLAVLQYTSGSTRTPRGVPVTHRHLAANVAAITGVISRDGRPHRTLSWLPLYHDMGLVGFLTVPMVHGWPLLLQSPAGFARSPAGWLTAMSRYRITASGAPNFAYALMARLLTAGMDLDLSALRFLLTGGEPVDAGTMARFVAAARPYGLDPSAIVPAYGLAEATLAVTFAAGAGVRTDPVDSDALTRHGRATPAPPGVRARRLVRLGVPVPGTSLRITDPGSGEPVGERTLGEVEVRGPAVVGHYRGDPPPPPGSWLRTGDLGYLTGTGADAELVVCDRAKDMLTAAGRNVFPQDIEAAAAAVTGVRPGGVAAFGVSGQCGERLIVAVESRRSDHATVREQVADAVRDEVGMAPHAVLTLPFGRLPKTSSGKLRRSEARRQYLSGRLTLSGERTCHDHCGTKSGHGQHCPQRQQRQRQRRRQRRRRARPGGAPPRAGGADRPRPGHAGRHRVAHRRAGPGQPGHAAAARLAGEPRRPGRHR